MRSFAKVCLTILFLFPMVYASEPTVVLPLPTDLPSGWKVERAWDKQGWEASPLGDKEGWAFFEKKCEEQKGSWYNTGCYYYPGSSANNLTGNAISID